MVIIMEPPNFVNLNRPAITCDLAIYSSISANAYGMPLRMIGPAGERVTDRAHALASYKFTSALCEIQAQILPGGSHIILIYRTLLKS